MVSGEGLVVFDFDWSLVEENSDTWVLQKLGALNIFKRLQSQGEAPSGILTLGWICMIISMSLLIYHCCPAPTWKVQTCRLAMDAAHGCCVAGCSH